MSYIPIVIDKSGRDQRSLDIFSKLLKERIIFINGTIDCSVSSLIVAQLLFLESEDHSKDIYLYINSPGGVVSSGLAIYDTMQYIASDVSTLCIGQACSMGALLLAAGQKGKRFALPNSRIMIHQPLGGFRGQATDIAIHTKEILQLKNNLNSILSYHTNHSISQIEKDTERDNFMSPGESKNYGIIDKVVNRRVITT